MFVPAKIDRYYRVTTDSILGYIAIEMKKALKSLCINGFKAFFHFYFNALKMKSVVTP